MTENPFEGDLAKTIKGAAYNIAAQMGVDPDDVEQEMLLAIVERYTRETAFLDQEVSYIVCFGAWRARNAMRQYLMQVTREVEVDVPTHHLETNYVVEDEGCNDMMIKDNMGSVAYDLDLGLVWVSMALDKLDETTRAIAHGIAAGLTSREIGTALGMSHTAVLKRKAQIAVALGS